MRIARREHSIPMGGLFRTGNLLVSLRLINYVVLLDEGFADTATQTQKEKN